jgi:hypothetical protein
VTDVAVRHEVTIVTDSGYPPTTATSAAHGDTFANDAVCADDQTGISKVVVSDLALAAQDSLWVYDGPRADLSTTTNHNVRQKPDALPKNAVASNNAKRTDVRAGTERRAVFYNRGGMNRHFSGRVVDADHGAEFRFRAERISDKRLAFEFPDRPAVLEGLHGKAKRIAGNNRAPKSSLVDAHEKYARRFLQRHRMDNQGTGSLRHGFNNQNARHHGVVWKMSRKMWLVEAYRLVPDRTFKRNDFGEALNKKKGGAMRQQFFDLLDIENQSVLSALTHCRPVSTSS